MRAVASEGAPIGPDSEAAWRRRALFFALLSLVLGLWLVFLLLRPDPSGDPLGEEEPAAESVEEPLPEPVPKTPAERLELRPASFADLPGWVEDDLSQALPALRASCGPFLRRDASSPVGKLGFAGSAADWRPACEAAGSVALTDPEAARRFFEDHFRPVAVEDDGEEEGLFTGYFEPTLRGSRRRGGEFTVPLYLRPKDLISVELGDFREDLDGRRLAGRLRGGRLEPYPDRREIDGGALAGQSLELVWVDDPVDAFFLHIQGSGRVELAEGGSLRVGYAAQNGHAYFAIGRDLIERGEVSREEMSLQAIRRWLRENPEQAEELLHKNPSYIFFRRLKGGGPVGSQGVVLTPGRSAAVDRRFHPLGAPLWVETSAPAATPDQPEIPIRRLFVAQDTGGAIVGGVRADLFWGPDGELAGRMKNPGRMWLLLPTEVVERGDWRREGGDG